MDDMMQDIRIHYPKRPVYVDLGDYFAWMFILLIFAVSFLIFLPPIINVLVASIMGIILTTVFITTITMLQENHSRYRKWEEEKREYDRTIRHSYIVMPNDQHEGYRVEKFQTLGQSGYDTRIRFFNRDEEILYLLHTGQHDRNSANG